MRKEARLGLVTKRLENCAAMCHKCIDMGYPYTQIDPSSGAVKYMFFSLTWRETFTKRWERKTVQAERDSPMKIRDASPKPDPQLKPTPDPTKKKGLKKGAGTEKSPAQKALNEAKKITGKVHTTLVSARSLRKTIKNANDGDELFWAQGNEVDRKLLAAIKSMQASVDGCQLATFLIKVHSRTAEISQVTVLPNQRHALRPRADPQELCCAQNHFLQLHPSQNDSM